jgi:hypothetical protein
MNNEIRGLEIQLDNLEEEQLTRMIEFWQNKEEAQVGRYSVHSKLQWLFNMI